MEIAAQGFSQTLGLAFLNTEHSGAGSDFSQVSLLRCHHNQLSTGSQHPGELRRIPWSEHHQDHVHRVIGYGQRTPNVPDEVGSIPVEPCSAAEREFGDVQAYRRSRSAFQDTVEVVPGARAGVENHGPGPLQRCGCQAGDSLGQSSVMSAVQESMPGSHHLRRISFEDCALACQQVEVTLLRGVEYMPGAANEPPLRILDKLKPPFANGTTEGGNGIGQHGFNPTVGRSVWCLRQGGGARLTKVKPEQLPLLNSVSAPAIHPDGTKAVVSVVRPDFDADAYVGQLWNVPLDTNKRPRRITRGFRDTSPAFSPDGLVLALLRSDAEGKAQLFVVESAGGEPQQVTDQHGGVSGFAWAPDSHRVVFTSRVAEPGRYGTVDGVTSGSEDARLIAVNQYRMNGVGYVLDQRQQLFVVDVPELGGEPVVIPRGRAAHERPGAKVTGVPDARQTTFGESDHEAPCFSADGRFVYFIAALHDGHDDDLVTSVYRIDATGGEPELIKPHNPKLQTVTAVRASTDGRSLFFTAQDLGDTGRDFVARNSVLYSMPVAGGDAAALTDVEHLDISGPLEPSGPDSVLLLNTALGSVELLDVTAAGSLTPLVHGARVVTGATVAANGEIAVSFLDASTAGDVGSLERGELRLLTDFSAELRNSSRVSEPLDFQAIADDGYPVNGWLVLPDGPGPHPVLLSIHGGPFSQYTGAFFDEAQVYAAAGYAVVMCNPRGSSGYGQSHGRVIKERMGTADMQDVLAFLDAALSAHAILDADSVGIMGGSYGGYLTAWTIAHDHRFKGAIVERGFLDPVSFAGTSDIGWFFGGEYAGATPGQLVAQSPLAVADSVVTPTLVIHSENDLRCPLEQGQRYYALLKERGIETSLLVFPSEDHELSRSGTPHHRKQRFEHILAWWARYLPTASNRVTG